MLLFFSRGNTQLRVMYGHSVWLFGRSFSSAEEDHSIRLLMLKWSRILLISEMKLEGSNLFPDHQFHARKTSQIWWRSVGGLLKYKDLHFARYTCSSKERISGMHLFRETVLNVDGFIYLFIINNFFSLTDSESWKIYTLHCKEKYID